MFRYLPEQASEHAAAMDWIHDWITDLSVFFTVAIVGAMLYFAVKYRKKGGVDHETPQIHGSHALELIWTIVPTIICIFVGYYGIVIFRDLRKVPSEALVVTAVGSQWKWDFEYSTGKKTIGELVLPVDKHAKIVLTSTDVNHGMFIPAMRVKSDAVKGQYTYLSFKPIETGEFHVFCSHYCGKDHSGMLAKLRVVPPAEYERWVNDKSEKEVPPVERGKILYAQKGCKSCHTLDGTRSVGPSWLKIVGKTGKLVGGGTYTADENYLRESILKPNAKVVEGYPPAMPAFEGQVSEADLVGLIAFMKTLDGSAPVPAAAPAAPAAAEDLSKLSPEERGKRIVASGKGAGAPCASCHSLDGSKLVGPTFKGISGRKAKWTDGTEYTVTDDYLKESIVKPNAHVVEGYAPAMMSFEGILSDDDIKDVIAYLKTVK